MFFCMLYFVYDIVIKLELWQLNLDCHVRPLEASACLASGFVGEEGLWQECGVSVEACAVYAGGELWRGVFAGGGFCPECLL